MNALLAIEESDPRVRESLDAGIWVEANDDDPASERSRQTALVNKVKRLPGLSHHAVPNGGKQSDWMRINAERMGVVAGEPDLGFDWVGGEARIEMKDGQGSLDRRQVERLNQLHRMGKKVAVCRTPAGALWWLGSIGAPVGGVL